MQFHFLEHVYAFSLPTHYFFCTSLLRFLPQPRCMGPLSAPCRWKVRGKVANRVETKGFFLLLSHIGAISKTAVPLQGVPNFLTWSPSCFSLPLCLSPSPIHRACCWCMKVCKWKGPPKWYREQETCLTQPFLLFTLSLAVQILHPIQITGILEHSCHKFPNWSGQMAFHHPQI